MHMWSWVTTCTNQYFTAINKLPAEEEEYKGTGTGPAGFEDPATAEAAAVDHDKNLTQQ